MFLSIDQSSQAVKKGAALLKGQCEKVVESKGGRQEMSINFYI